MSDFNKKDENLNDYFGFDDKENKTLDSDKDIKDKENIESNPVKKAQVEEFEHLRYKIQVETMQGSGNATEAKQMLQEKYAELLKDEEIKKYFDAEIQSDGSDIENIPYKETNMYVRKIINNYRMYQTIYVEK